MLGLVRFLDSMSGFTWSDEKGMGVTDETMQQWNDITKVCRRMSSLSMTANYS
jgi:hypothetical protein